jgi:hypothetical protein
MLIKRRINPGALSSGSSFVYRCRRGVIVAVLENFTENDGGDGIIASVIRQYC